MANNNSGDRPPMFGRPGSDLGRRDTIDVRRYDSKIRNIIKDLSQHRDAAIKNLAKIITSDLTLDPNRYMAKVEDSVKARFYELSGE